MTKSEVLKYLKKAEYKASLRQVQNKRYDARQWAKGAAKALRTAIEAVEQIEEPREEWIHDDIAKRASIERAAAMKKERLEREQNRNVFLLTQFDRSVQ